MHSTAPLASSHSSARLVISTIKEGLLRELLLCFRLSSANKQPQIAFSIDCLDCLNDCLAGGLFHVEYNNYSRDLVNRISAAILLPAKSMSCRDRVLRSFPRNKSTNTPLTKNDATFVMKSAAQPLRLILWQWNSVKGTIIIEFWVGSCLGTRGEQSKSNLENAIKWMDADR